MTCRRPDVYDVAAATLYHLADEPGPGMADLRSVTTLFNRVVAYVDRAPRSHG